MSNLMIFNNIEFGEIRTVAINNDPYLMLNDVCRILELNNVSQVKARLNESGVITNEVIDSLGRTQQATFINESNFYKVLFQSRKPQAEKFTEYVTSEILPAIRKHGAYMTDSVLEQAVSDPDFMIGLLVNLKEEKEKRQLAEERNEKNKPKVLMAETMLASKESKDVGILSTKLQEMGIKNMGRNNLYKYFRDHGYVIKTGERRNLPTQRSIDLGIMDTDTRPYFRNDEIFYEDKTKITPKGFEYFINKFNQEAM